MVEFADKTLTCSDCGTSFVFTAGEQQFFASRGFSNEPKRCQNCRSSRRAQRGAPAASGGGDGSRSREMFKVTCAECGNETMVPFQPRGVRPVYCQDCFSKQRSRSF